MRFFVLHCLLLASLAAASSDGRHKRDLSFLRNFISSAFSGRSEIKIEESSAQKDIDYKLFRIPGYDDIMIKVIPKKSVKKLDQPANLNAFGSVVGTKSKDDTLVAVKEVSDMLSSGILGGQQNTLIKETVVPMFPALRTNKYVTAEKIRANKVVTAEKIKVPVIEARTPVITDVIKPAEEKIEVKKSFEPKYSFKQMKNREPVITYTAHYNPEMKVIEDEKLKAEVPMCIKERVNEAIILGADPYRLTSEEVYQTSPVVDFSYPTLEANMYVQNLFNNDFITERLGAVAEIGMSPQAYKDTPIRYSLSPKRKPVNRHPLHRHKSSHSDIVNINSFKDTSETKKDTKLDDATNLTEYIDDLSKEGRIKIKTFDSIKAEDMVAMKENIANGRIPEYVYNYQRNPNTGKMVTAADRLKTEDKTNNFVPSINSEKLKVNAKVQVGMLTNALIPKTQSPHSVAVGHKNTVVTKPISFRSSSIIVPEINTYSYQQKHADGSIVSIKGRKNIVSVDVKERESTKLRGDIPGI